MRLGAVADLHFGKNIDGNSRFNRDEETFLQVKKALRKMVEMKVDAIAVLGDLSHTNHPSISTNTYIARTLIELDSCSLPVLVFPGNHDFTYDGRHVLKPFMNSMRLKNVTIFDRVGQWEELLVVPHIPRVDLGDVRSKEEHVAKIREVYESVLSKTTSSILLTHAQISGATVGRGYVLESGVLEIKEALSNIKLIVAGDIHKRQKYSLGSMTVVYPGSLTQTDFGEIGETKGFVVISTSDLSVQFVDVPGYVEYKTLQFESMEEVDKVPEEVWQHCIVDVVVKNRGSLSSIISKVEEKDPLSVRGIRVEDANVNVTEVSDKIVNESYQKQFERFLKSAKISSDRYDSLFSLANEIMEEARAN